MTPRTVAPARNPAMTFVRFCHRKGSISARGAINVNAQGGLKGMSGIPPVFPKLRSSSSTCLGEYGSPPESSILPADQYWTKSLVCRIAERAKLAISQANNNSAVISSTQRLLLGITGIDAHPAVQPA